MATLQTSSCKDKLTELVQPRGNKKYVIVNTAEDNVSIKRFQEVLTGLMGA